MTVAVLLLDTFTVVLAVASQQSAGTEPVSPLVQGTVRLVLGVLCVSILLALLRLMRGPRMADRVVALDLTAVIIVGMISVHAIGSGEPTFISVAIVLALIAFLGTVAFAFYLQKGGQP